MEPPHRAYCIWSVIAFFNLDLQSQFRGSLFQRNVANKTKRTRFQFYGSLLQGSFAKETYHLKESTTCSHPIQPIAFGVCLTLNPIAFGVCLLFSILISNLNLVGLFSTERGK